MGSPTAKRDPIAKQPRDGSNSRPVTVARYLNNRAFRDELKARVDERFAETLTLTHNRDRGVVSPRGYDVSTFEVIETTKDLPVNMLGLAEESAVHIGKRYAIKA